MALAPDLIDFDLIETHKENIQSLPGGRSARQLVSILTPTISGRAVASPSLDETKTLNDAIRQEYEIELQSIAESDDPLDIYDRYVKWTLNAYPSAQATPQSQLLPLLERATKTFLPSTHYKNDPRYLKLWLHYIRFFSDSPRETFAFLARHNIGEGLGLFYEEFAAWLEGAGRWMQAEEVYKLGLEREARPMERLMRKYGQFQKRFASRLQDEHEPTSPALPTVRPALAAKIDPFASTPRSGDPQAGRTPSGVGGTSTSKSGKPKMAIFSDSSESTPQASSATTKGWESIGSLRERKKENTIEPKPWSGETLKAGKKGGQVSAPKMTIFKDQTSSSSSSSSSRAPESKSLQTSSSEQVVVNPRTRRVERVFVNLEAVYPNRDDPCEEISFEELRSFSRGWAARDWRKPAIAPKPLQAISRNIQRSPRKETESQAQDQDIAKLTEEFQQKAVVVDHCSSSSPTCTETQAQIQEPKQQQPKLKKTKIREIRQEAQTIKTNLESPTRPKLKRKMSAEPTMTFHSKAATDEIYNIFNQPLKCEALAAAGKDDGQGGGFDSEYDDDEYSTAGESTGTGRISGATSEFGDEDTMAYSARTNADENTGITNHHAESSSSSPWSEFTVNKTGSKSRSRKYNNNTTTTTGANSGEELTENMTQSQENQTQGLRQDFEFDTQAIEAMAREAEQELAEDKTNTQSSPSVQQQQPEEAEVEIQHNKPRFVPLPPEDYEPTPVRPFRDPAALAQNRIPFMTPIVEKTESSLAPSTAYIENDEKNYFFDSKTPSRSASGDGTRQSPINLDVDQLFLNSPFRSNNNDTATPNKRKLKSGASKYEIESASAQKLRSKFSAHDLASPRKKIQVSPRDFKTSPEVKNEATDSNTFQPTVTKSLPPTRNGPLIQDLQCNPVDVSIRAQILESMYPPLSSYKGFHDRSSQKCERTSQIQRFVARAGSSKVKASPRKGQGEKAATQAVPPILAFEGANRVYAVKKELGKGAFAPVYLVESYEHSGRGDGTDDENELTAKSLDQEQKQSKQSMVKRAALEAIKAEQPPSAWEFHILRLLSSRLGDESRAMESIIKAHECHVFADECYLVLEYRSQGTLLDLVNIVRSDNVRLGKSGNDGLEEVVAIFFSIELLRTLEQCHRVGILHGDLKADNCLVRLEIPGGTAAVAAADHQPSSPYQRDGSCGWNSKGLTLIDVGRGIDFCAFQPRVKFIADWAACAQDCVEIREQRPWTWQIDYFGAAGVIHSLLFGKYIETVPVGGSGVGLGRVGGGAGVGGVGEGLETAAAPSGRKQQYKLKDNLKRYWQQELWGKVFEVLLNPDTSTTTINNNDDNKLQLHQHQQRAGNSKTSTVSQQPQCLDDMAKVRGMMEEWLEEEGRKKDSLRRALKRCEGLVGGCVVGGGGV